MKKIIPDIEADVETLNKRTKKLKIMFYVYYFLGIGTCALSFYIYFKTWLIVIPLGIFIMGAVALIIAPMILLGIDNKNLLIYLKRRER